MVPPPPTMRRRQWLLRRQIRWLAATPQFARGMSGRARLSKAPGLLLVTGALPGLVLADGGLDVGRLDPILVDLAAGRLLRRNPLSEAHHVLAKSTEPWVARPHRSAADHLSVRQPWLSRGLANAAGLLIRGMLLPRVAWVRFRRTTPEMRPWLGESARGAQAGRAAAAPRAHSRVLRMPYLLGGLLSLRVLGRAAVGRGRASGGSAVGSTAMRGGERGGRTSAARGPSVDHGLDEVAQAAGQRRTAIVIAAAAATATAAGAAADRPPSRAGAGVRTTERGIRSLETGVRIRVGKVGGAGALN